MDENKLLSELMEIAEIESSRAFNTSKTGRCQTDNSSDTITRKFLKDESLLKKTKELVSNLLSLNKKNEHYWALMAYIHDFEGNFKEEINCIYKALEINYLNINNWSDLAFAYRNIGNFDMYDEVLFNMDELSEYFSTLTKVDINKKTIKKALEIIKNSQQREEPTADKTKLDIKEEATFAPSDENKLDYAEINITKNCNQKCIFCLVEKSKEYLSKDDIIKQMEEYKKKGVKTLFFSGGEPTLHPDLLELTRKSNELGFDLRIFTNGANLNEDLIKKLIKNSVKGFLISVNTINKQRYKEISTKDNLDKTLNILEILNKENVDIAIHTIIIKQNYKELYQIVKFLKSNYPKISLFNFKFVLNEGSVSDKKEIVPRLSEIELSLHKAMDFCKKNNLNFVVERVPLCYMGKYAAHSAETQQIVMSFKQHGISLPNFVTSDACKICNFENICAELSGSYARIYGTDELYPIFDEPKKIIDEVNKINKGATDEKIISRDKIKEEGFSSESRVSIAKCKEYQLKALKKSIKKSLDNLGGLEKFIKPGEKVLLKPNLIDPFTPDKAATTHFLFLKAVVQLVKEITNYVWVGDSSGGKQPGTTEKAYLMSGTKRTVDDENISFVNFQEQEFIARDILNYEVMERTDFAKALFKADAIINLPKLKTHGVTFFTGAIKNFFGCIMPEEREYLHKEFSNRHDFSKGLVDIYSFLKRKVRLNIMDAVIGMEGDQGPSYGDPKKVGLIIASDDAVALDAVASEIIGYNSLAIPTTKDAHERGIGCGDLKNIEIIGEKLDDVKVADFKKNSLFDFINTKKKEEGYAKEFIFEPVFTKNCIRCKTCKMNCPVNAIAFNPNGKIDRKKCIHCYCCHEMCPSGGIKLKKKIMSKK